MEIGRAADGWVSGKTWDCAERDSSGFALFYGAGVCGDDGWVVGVRVGSGAASASPGESAVGCVDGKR